MDRLAHAAAHVALGRPPASTAIEISMGGIELVCESGAVTFCVAGGRFQVAHAGAVTKSWCVRTLRAGDVLAIRPGQWGSWAYLAFAGELVCKQWAGSTATHSLSGFGGGSLTSGGSITVHNAKVAEEREGDLPLPAAACLRTAARVVLGPQTGSFEPDAIAALQGGSFSITSAYDRMGMRLSGPKLLLRDALSIPSEPVVRGSIQVSGDGVASVLLADHQTTGGYPKVATILSCDIDGLTQLRAGDRVTFQAVEADEAISLVRSSAQVRSQFLQSIAEPRGSLDHRLMRENLISGMHRAGTG
jgi:allophanate hydrolase